MGDKVSFVKMIEKPTKSGRTKLVPGPRVFGTVEGFTEGGQITVRFPEEGRTGDYFMNFNSGRLLRREATPETKAPAPTPEPSSAPLIRAAGEKVARGEAMTYDEKMALRAAIEQETEQARLARRSALDDLSTRTRKPGPLTPEDVELRLSAATESIPGVDLLRRAAATGDRAAQNELSDLARDAIRHLLRNTGARVETSPTLGVYGSSYEPSARVRVRGSGESIAEVLAAVERFATGFGQEQVHVLRGVPTGARIGETLPDGSRIVPHYTIELAREFSAPEVEALAKKTGLDGFTVEGKTLTTYYNKDVNDTAAIAQFKQSVAAAQASLGADARRNHGALTRLGTYGNGGAGTIPYGRIRGELPTPPERRVNPAAQRIATRLAGREVRGTPPADTLTPEQAGIQTRIAEAFSQLPLDERLNPNTGRRVTRAYAELAAEVADQYAGLPVRVELVEQVPYKNSAEMRRDIFDHNHLFVLKTDASSFGPPGANYADHPLLRQTNVTDQRGFPLRVNDMLRAVHDYYAHTMRGAEFGPRGEEAAWRTHMEMTRSPWALWALTSETRGQNSWVNFGPYGEFNRANPGKLIYAEQKTGLLPIEFAKTGDPRLDAEMDAITRSEDYSKRKLFTPEDQNKLDQLGAIMDAGMASSKQAKEYRALTAAKEAAKPKEVVDNNRLGWTDRHNGWLLPDGSFIETDPAEALAFRPHGLRPGSHGATALSWLQKNDPQGARRLRSSPRDGEVESEMFRRGWVRVAQGGGINYLQGKPNAAQERVLTEWAAETAKTEAEPI